MIVQLGYTAYVNLSIIHSLESVEQSDLLQSCFDMDWNRVSLTLLQESSRILQTHSSYPVIVHDDDDYVNDQSIEIPGVKKYKHIIGSLYYTVFEDDKPMVVTVLVDVDEQKKNT
jgi:hypothetical protein